MAQSEILQTRCELLPSVFSPQQGTWTPNTSYLPFLIADLDAWETGVADLNDADLNDADRGLQTGSSQSRVCCRWKSTLDYTRCGLPSPEFGSSVPLYAGAVDLHIPVYKFAIELLVTI
jgi:hypothetical protein